MNRLEQLRLERHWNMKEAAQALGLSYTTYVGYEKGEREPNFETICKMAQLYDVDVTYLMGTSPKRGYFPTHDDPTYQDPFATEDPAYTQHVQDMSARAALQDLDKAIKNASPEDLERMIAVLKALDLLDE